MKVRQSFSGCVFVASALLCAGALAAEAAEESGSVLVQTQPPRRGSLPQRIFAYGAATPATNGGMTLSVQADGRVMAIHVTAGEAVRAGQTLLEFHLAPAASSAYQQAASALELARQQQTRTARLLSQQLATRDQLAQADKAVSDARAALAALEAEHGGKAQQLITAPFDGVVSALPVTQGERVAAGAPLLTITRTGGLVITVGVEPAQRRGVRVGQKASLAPLSEGEPVLHGTVSRVDRVLNPKTRLIDLDVTPDAADAGELLEGAAFRADIQTGELQGWVVPRDAVLSDAQGEFLFQVAGAKAARVRVKRIGGDDDNSVVEGALDPARPLITLGNYQLKDGARVRLNQAAARASGS
jgi:membrane fusion protein (multidrug efflux system)